MALDTEAAGSKPPDIRDAAVNLEYALTQPAAEVMVMLTSCHFVPRGFAGQAHHHEPLLRHQRVKGAIDGGHAEARDNMLRPDQDLLRGERTCGALDDILDCLPLTRDSIHPAEYTGSGLDGNSEYCTVSSFSHRA